MPTVCDFALFFCWMWFLANSFHSNFNLFDGPMLDRGKSDNVYDLHCNPESSLSPSVMTSFVPHNAIIGGARPSVASLGFHMLTIPTANHDHQAALHSSNESIHSTISVY